MGSSMNLEIITPSDKVISEEIEDLYLPAYFGDAGILKNHLPYISLLKFGELSFEDSQKKRHYLYIENGILEVSGNSISVISDFAIKGEDIDPDAIARELEIVENEINSASSGDITPRDLAEALIKKKKLISKKRIVEKLT